MSGREIRDVLHQAAAIVRGGWCRNALAKNAEGKVTGPRSSDAVAWCALGAIQKICGGPEDGGEVKRSLREVIWPMEITQWNDGRVLDAEEVARTFEEAARITC